MNIAFDVDGLLTDLQKFQLEYGGKFFKKKYNMDIKNPKGMSIKEIFDCTDEQEYEFWKRHIVFYATKWPIRPGAKELIKKLQEDGNNNFIISSRIKTSDNDAVGKFMRYLLKTWLKNNDIHIKDENFKFCSNSNTSSEKRRICVENNIDIMIDDDAKNISEINKVTSTICFKTECNEGKVDTYSTNLFYEIYNKISERYSEKKFKYLNYKDRLELTDEELKKYYELLRQDYLQREPSVDIKKTEATYLKIYPMLKQAFDLKYPATIENKEMIPDEQGIIYIINHRSLIDCPLAMSAIGKRPIHLLLKAEFLESKFCSFLKSIGSVFVHRGNKDSEIASSEELTKLVLNGTNILICPEGTRNKTEAELLPFKKGAVSIAQKTGRPIVPISIVNIDGDITLKFGEKFYVDIFDDIELKNKELSEYFLDLLRSNYQTASSRKNSNKR